MYPQIDVRYVEFVKLGGYKMPQLPLATEVEQIEPKGGTSRK
jgi:hypothetical protein